MSQERFWILLTRKIAREASPEDLSELEKLVQLHPEWQYALQNLQDLWQSTPPPVDLSEEEDSYLLHLHRMQEKNIPSGTGETSGNEGVYEMPRRSNRRRLSWLISGTVVAASVAALLVFNPFSPKVKGATQEAVNINEISTRLGSKTQIKLPDGSVVWLNAGSKLVYDKDYGHEDRQVTLTGEAYFDVVKDPNKPFLVHTSSVEVRVLGTLFNVKAYPDDKTTETSLIRGSLEVSIRSRPLDKIILSSNEKLVVENKVDSIGKEWTSAEKKEEQPMMTLNQIKRNSRDNTINETQWIDNKLVFDNEPLEEIALKMERWFAVEIEITDWELKQKRLTGTFERENVEQALEGLAYASTRSFVFERKGNKITIHR